MRDLDTVCPPGAAREAADAYRYWLHAGTCDPDEAMQRAVAAALSWIERDAAREREHSRLREDSSQRMGAIVSGRLR